MALILCLAACDEEPIHYSAPVGITMTAASGDVDDGLILEEKNINTESGNPYEAFVADARDALGGADPGAIDVEDVTITIDGMSFDDIFVGRCRS